MKRTNETIFSSDTDDASTALVMMLVVSETELVYECDMVLLAMGFVGPEKSILDELSLAQDARGNIDTYNVKYLTSVPRVYTAGGTYCSQSTSFTFNEVV